MSPINLDRIQSWIDQSRLDPTQPITLKELTRTRAIHGIKDGVKLLARGATSLTSPVHLVVSKASAQAIAAVEALGGSVTTRFYNKQSISRIRQGLSDPMVSLRWDPEAMGNPNLGPAISREDIVKNGAYQYRLPDPTDRKELEYYRDPKHRGYLAHTLKEGELPSLYWKPERLQKWVPGTGESAKKKDLEANRVW
jgi:large subunit ribosomal protein L15